MAASGLMSAHTTSARALPPPAVSSMVWVAREPMTALVPSPQSAMASQGPIAKVSPAWAVNVGGVDQAA